MDYWMDLWRQGQSPWHSTDPNPYLVKFMSTLNPNDKDQWFVCHSSHLQFFLPLCGKAGDIRWLYEKGHRVWGIECSPKAIEEFFQENQIPLSIERVNENCTKYMSLDERIQVFVCDFFRFDPKWIGSLTVDRVFDRGSLVAVGVQDRVQYAAKMREILFQAASPAFKYLLSTYEYDPREFDGPPRTVWREEIHHLFGGIDRQPT
eukprot:TCALIF_10669-PA protein Name:"Similar to tpmt Probable thiopurine S-methyltransferase (Danio rerio)" AED:0.12 eAED:0.12 QI:58/0/0/1/0.5/0.33/3/0/204